MRKLKSPDTFCEICEVDGRRTRMHNGACWMHGTPYMKRSTCRKCKHIIRARIAREICRKCLHVTRPNRAMKRTRVKKEKTNTPKKEKRAVRV